MKKIVQFLIILFIVTSFFIEVAYSASSEIQLETDPSAFALKGYALSLKRSSTFFDNLTIGFGFTTLELPEFWIKETNEGEGWEAKIKNGIELYLDYYFKPSDAWFVGLNISSYEYEVTREQLSSVYKSMQYMARVGYRWKPFGKNFYLLPWVGYGKHEKVSGKNTINGESFDLPEWGLVPSINLGFSF